MVDQQKLGSYNLFEMGWKWFLEVSLPDLLHCLSKKTQFSNLCGVSQFQHCRVQLMGGPFGVFWIGDTHGCKFGGSHDSRISVTFARVSTILGIFACVYTMFFSTLPGMYYWWLTKFWTFMVNAKFFNDAFNEHYFHVSFMRLWSNKLHASIPVK